MKDVCERTQVQARVRLRFADQTIGGVVRGKEHVEDPNEVALSDVTDVADRDLLVEVGRIWLPNWMSVTQGSELLLVNVAG